MLTWRGIARALAWTAGSVVLLVLLIVAVATAMVRTETGRGWLANLAMDTANGLVPGTLSLEHLDRLDPWGLSLRDLRVVDPQDTQVARIEAFELRLEPLALLDGRLSIPSVSVKGAEIDLRHLDAEDRGLLAALVPPDEADEPEEPAGEPLIIDVAKAQLEAITLHAELPGRGPLEVTELTLAASFYMREHMRAGLDALSATVADTQGHVLALGPIHGEYRDDGELSRASLKARSGKTSVSLEASLVPPPTAGFADAPLSVELAIEQLGNEPLALLGLGDALDGVGLPLSASLTAKGSLNDLHSRLRLQTPGGGVVLAAEAKDLDAVELTLETTELALARVHRDAPPSKLTLKLDAETRVAGAPDEMPLSAHLHGAKLDARPLPSVRVKAHLADETLRVERLDVRGQGVEAQFAGHYDQKRGTLSAEGDARARNLVLGETRVGKLDAHVKANGALPLPRVDVRVDVADLHAGGQRVSRAQLALAGGPRDYTLALEGAVPEGNLRLSGSARRENGHVVLSLQGDGRVLEHPLSLSLRDLHVGMDGSVRLPHASAVALGQSAQVGGSLDAGSKAAALHLTADALDLAALGRALKLEPGLTGQADVEVHVEGSTAAPHAVVKIDGQGLGLKGGPAHDAQVRLELDPEQDRLEARASVQAALLGQLDFSLDGTLSKRGPIQTRLLGADYQSELTLRGLEVGYAEGLVEDLELPVEGTVDLSFTLAGPIRAPVIAAQLGAQLQHAEAAFATILIANVAYQPGEARVEVKVDDELGTWAHLKVALSPQEKRTLALVDSLSQLGHLAAWQTDLTLEPRDLARVADILSLPEDLAGTIVEGKLHANHPPRKEPEAELNVRAHVPAASAASERCQPLDTHVDLTATLEDANAALTLTGDTTQGPWLKLQAGAKTALSPTLADGSAPHAEDVQYAMRAKHLDFAHVPVACETVYGAVALESRGEDLLGDSPHIELAVDGNDFGFDKRARLSLNLEASVTPEALEAQGQLSYPGGESELSARLPLHFHDGVIEADEQGPMSADLVLGALPLAPLIAPGMPISRVRGHIDGEAHARGSLASPRFSGALALADVYLTASAIAQPLRDVSGQVELSEKHVVIRKLRAHDGEGHLTINGKLQLPREEHAQLDLKVELVDFPLRQQGQVAAEANLEATLHADVQGDHTEAKLSLHDVDMWLLDNDSPGQQSLELHPDIEDPRMKSVEPAPDAEDSASTLHLVMDASDRFWVKRDDFAVKLSSKLDIHVEDEGVRIHGDTTIDRGYLQMFGETFDIDRQSKLQFVGGDPPDPALSIGAKTVARKTSKQVAIRITGRASAPKVEFLVDDVPTTAGDAVMAIMGGDSSGDDEDASGQAKSFVAGMMASMMAVAARRELGAAAPIIMIEPGDEMASSRVRAGFELDALIPKFMKDVVRSAYVEGIVGGEESGGSVQGGVLLELYFPHSLVGSGQYGPGQTWSVDLGWEP